MGYNANSRKIKENNLNRCDFLCLKFNLLIALIIVQKSKVIYILSLNFI